MPLNLFYTMVQKSQKWPKTQIKGGGPALILKTIGNRKGDCAWSCSRWQTQPAWENLQIAKHKSGQCAEWMTLICALRFADFLMQVVFVTSNNFTHNLLFYFQ